MLELETGIELWVRISDGGLRLESEVHGPISQTGPRLSQDYALIQLWQLSSLYVIMFIKKLYWCAMHPETKHKLVSVKIPQTCILV